MKKNSLLIIISILLFSICFNIYFFYKSKEVLGGQQYSNGKMILKENNSSLAIENIISKNELKIECKKVINNEKVDYLYNNYSALLQNYSKGLKMNEIDKNNDLYKTYKELISKNNDERKKYLKEILNKTDKSSMGYSSIYDSLNGTNTCRIYRSDRERCVEQSNIIKEILGLYKYDYNTFLTEDYKSVYFYSLKNNLNFKEEYNKIFLNECLSL